MTRTTIRGKPKASAGATPDDPAGWRLCPVRLAVSRRVGAVILALAFLGSMGVSSALAASITVNSLADVAANDGQCTLREAITAANTNTASGAAAGECAAGSGAGRDTIGIGVSGTITLTSALPAIASDVLITGGITAGGAPLVTVSGAGITRVFDIASGTVTLADLNVPGGQASGS